MVLTTTEGQVLLKENAWLNGVEAECTYIFFIGSGSKTGYPKAPVLWILLGFFTNSFLQLTAAS